MAVEWLRRDLQDALGEAAATLLALARSVARAPRPGGLATLAADIRDTVAWWRELRRINN